ncbi:MAG TPA: DUF420 domain-containing protein [Candidatus Hydrogenedentes bacterium]|nr:DUF420 domain-containing protein [Candidatus Hydrogenedentota bacterium]HNT86422.1 DUF420 domain-containing protein [Candidatus Hydrogenedentota bacterium]
MTGISRLRIMMLLVVTCAAAAGSETLPVEATVPDFALTDSNNAPFSKAMLDGKVWVGYFFFSTCSGPCPLMNRAMADVAREFADTPDVAFAGFSVDPKVDTPERLAEYAKQFDADTTRWHFLTGDLNVIKALGVALKVGAADEPIFHSTRFILVDRQGRVRGYHTGTEIDGVAQLKRDMRVLLGERDAPASQLPTINAILNAVAACFLLAGWIGIKRFHDPTLHKKMMLAAFFASVVFLACYLYYHAQTGARTPYQGEGVLRMVYYTILFTHIPLAGLMVPFILAALYFALRRRFDLHTRITRWVWPVWMYVSVTGVLIYLMLYRL